MFKRTTQISQLRIDSKTKQFVNGVVNTGRIEIDNLDHGDQLSLFVRSIEPVENGNGRTIVALHGSAQTMHTWDDVAALSVKEGTRVVTVDQRGHGKSDWCPHKDYSHNAMANDLDLLIKNKDLFQEDEQLTIVGMSMGGLNLFRAMTDERLAVGNDERVVANVFVDITPTVKEEGSAAMIDFVKRNLAHDSIEDFVEAAHEEYPHRSKDVLRDRLIHNLKYDEEKDKWIWIYDTDIVTTKNITDRAYEREEPLWEQYADVATPGLLITGEHSPFTDDSQRERFVNCGDALRKVVNIKEAAHSVQGEQPERFHQAVQDFLKMI